MSGVCVKTVEHQLSFINLNLTEVSHNNRDNIIIILNTLPEPRFIAKVWLSLGLQPLPGIDLHYILDSP